MKAFIYVCSLLLLFANSVQGQEKKEVPAFRWGVFAGLNGYNAHTLNLSGDRGRLGIELGANVQWNLSAHDSHWYLYGDVSLVQLRSKMKYNDYVTLDGQAFPNSDKKDAYYLHVPIHIGYDWSLGRNCSIFTDMGPYVALGLFGQHRYLESSLIETEEYKYVLLKYHCDNMFGKYGYRRFDWGVGARLGVELFKHYQAGASYDYGIPHVMGGLNKHNCNFTFFVGYTF